MTTFGLLLPTLGPPGMALDVDAPVEIACWAEDSGFEHVWVGDHIVHPTQFLESLVVLSMVAARTTRIRFGPAVLQLPMRQLAVVAKQTSTLAVMSHGRLSLGVGLGGEYPDEWVAAGVPLAERGARLSEHVRLLQRLWTGQPVDESGRFTRLPSIAMQPAPGSIPILFGARSPAALQRTAELGDGWIGFMHSPAGFHGMVTELDRLRAEAGRGDLPFRRAMMVSFRIEHGGGSATSRSGEAMAALEAKMSKYIASGSPDAITTRLREYVAAGCDHLIMVPYVEGSWARDDLEVLRTEIIPNVD
jgi:alkanesulfonate monooxygenase SsuD/methylene tetrahydromethanopterin reductase-like flavin-dependent oxidoreductase (luciferase family)